MPHFDGTISLGNILTVVGFFWALWMAGSRLYVYMDRRVSVFENVLKDHARTLIDHANRMEKQDDLLIKLVGDVQRLVGRMEAETVRRSDRP